MLQYCRIIFCQEIHFQNRPVCWSVIVKKEQTVGSPVSGTFISERIPKAMMSIYIFLIRVGISVTFTSEFPKLYREFRKDFQSIAYKYKALVE
jgi:hypothetical protein